MPTDVVIQVRGLDELLRKFKELPNKHIKTALRKGLRAGQKIITATAKASAPVQSGALQKNIKTKAGRRSRNSVSIKTTLGEGFYKGKTFYGAFQEFGWKTGSSKSEDRRQIEGKHYMEKAAKRVGDAAGKIMVERTRYELEAAVKASGNG